MDAVPARSPEAGTWFPILVTIAFAALVVVGSIHHEPWRDEIHAWRMGIDSADLTTLYRNARYEGHPLLFHAVLHAVGLLSRTWAAAVLLHIIIACGSAWLILRHAPFPRLERLLAVGGYFLVYEYAVVVRSYGLGVFLALLACALWTSTRRRPFWITVILLLLANTSVMGIILAAALAIAFAYDAWWESGNGLARRVRLSRRQAAVIGGVGAAALLLGIAQLMLPADAPFRGNGALAGGFSPWKLGVNATVFARAFMPVAPTSDGGTYWGGSIETSTQAGLALHAGLSALVALVALLAVSRRRTALVLVGSAWSAYLLFFVLIYPGAMRHHGHVTIAWLLGYWLANAGPASTYPAFGRGLLQQLSPWRRRVAIALLMSVFLAGPVALIRDIRSPFSDSMRIAEVLRADTLAALPVIAVSHGHALTVAGLLDRPFISPLEGRISTFSVDPEPSPVQAAQATDSVLQDFSGRDCAVILVDTKPPMLSAATRARARLITETAGAPLSAERYSVWLIPGTASPECDALIDRR